jgi:hypothetical protein
LPALQFIAGRDPRRGQQLTTNISADGNATETRAKLFSRHGSVSLSGIATRPPGGIDDSRRHSLQAGEANPRLAESAESGALRFGANVRDVLAESGSKIVLMLLLLD